MSEPACVAGVDGARGGWVVVLLDGDDVHVELCESFSAVRGLVDPRDAAVVAVDMPMGLAETSARSADREARLRLGHRRSTLFPTPARAVLGATTHPEAVERSRAAIGVGISIQAWNLVPRIRELRAAVDPNEADRFVECHPETTFAALAGHPLVPKKTHDGQRARLDVLRAHIDPAALKHPLPGAATDDVLDAAAAAISARRLHVGEAEILGDGRCDAAGYPHRIIV